MNKIYNIEYAKSFKKDLKKAKKQNKDLSLLQKIMIRLTNQEVLEKKYKDHFLKGKFSHKRECHLKPDWLLIYRIDKQDNTIIFERTGSHSELFK